MKAVLLAILNPTRLILIALAFAFLWFIIWGDQGIYQRERLRFLKSKLQRETIQIEQDISKLEEEKELLNDEKHLESVIRKELGYIKPGETIYEIKDE